MSITKIQLTEKSLKSYKGFSRITNNYSCIRIYWEIMRNVQLWLQLCSSVLPLNRKEYLKVQTVVRRGRRNPDWTHFLKKCMCVAYKIILNAKVQYWMFLCRITREFYFTPIKHETDRCGIVIALRAIKS